MKEGKTVKGWNNWNEIKSFLLAFLWQNFSFQNIDHLFLKKKKSVWNKKNGKKNLRVLKASLSWSRMQYFTNSQIISLEAVMNRFVKKLFVCPGTLLGLWELTSLCKGCTTFLILLTNYILVYTSLMCLCGRQTHWPMVPRNIFAAFSTNCCYTCYLFFSLHQNWLNVINHTWLSGSFILSSFISPAWKNAVLTVWKRLLKYEK